MSSLYVIATPIGNLEDISLRALRILKEVKLIAAEDTRKTKILLNKYDIKTPASSYFEHNKLTKLHSILQALETGDVALVSDAGMPGISDPGYELVKAAIEQGFAIVPVPGASAITSALAASGLPTDRFLYLGFLPPRTTARRSILDSVREEPGTLIVLEAPHRIPAMLNDVLLSLGDRHIAVCRELTKIHEEIFRGTVSQSIAHFTSPRGEFTLIIEGKRDKTEPQMTPDIITELRRLRAAGVPAKEAIGKIGERTGIPRKELYRAWLGQT